MRILVTGANGYIGSHVVKRLLDYNHEVIACDINSSNIDLRAIYVERDIFCINNSDNLFQEFNSPDICIHLAWRDGFKHNSDNHLLDFSAHYAFLTNLINNGLKQLAVMGTMHEIGYHVGIIDENTPCNPLSMYGISKNALRQALCLYIKDRDCMLQWMRGFYIYGDDLMNHSIFTKLLKLDREGKAEFPFNSGENMYDFIQVKDLVSQICAVVLQNKISGIINCCSGKPITLADKVEEFIRINHLKIQLKYGAFPDRPYDSPCIYGDSTKIKEILHNQQS